MSPILFLGSSMFCHNRNRGRYNELFFGEFPSLQEETICQLQQKWCPTKRPICHCTSWSTGARVSTRGVNTYAVLLVRVWPGPVYQRDISSGVIATCLAETRHMQEEVHLWWEGKRQLYANSLHCCSITHMR